MKTNLPSWISNFLGLMNFLEKKMIKIAILDRKSLNLINNLNSFRIGNFKENNSGLLFKQKPEKLISGGQELVDFRMKLTKEKIFSTTIKN